jgi:hypothetical protein
VLSSQLVFIRNLFENWSRLIWELRHWRLRGATTLWALDDLDRSLIRATLLDWTLVVGFPFGETGAHWTSAE